MRAVFFGTPDVAAVALDAILHSSHDIAGVVTQPDRPRGRSGAPHASPVKNMALEAGLPVLQPESPKADSFAEELRALAADVLAIVAYGHILPRNILEIAPAVNAHFSLLPAYRGAAPVQRAILAGETTTGVSTFLLEPAIDSGPLLLTEAVAIGVDETSGDLLSRLAPIGARLLVESLTKMEAGSLEPQAQDASRASPAPKLKVDEGEIDWTQPVEHVRNLVRAFNPSPGAWTSLSGKRIKIWRTVRAPEHSVPGIAGSFDAGGAVACGDGALLIAEIQPEGKRRMTGEEFARGIPPGASRVFRSRS